jgi:hypothetical protein
MNDPYASEADTLALLRPDQRSDAEKKLDAMLEERGAWEQGSDAYPILYHHASDHRPRKSALTVWHRDAGVHAARSYGRA